jgi:hypothetical protein
MEEPKPPGAPRGVLAKFKNLLGLRKPMSPSKKKKKQTVHYRNPKVSPGSTAGKMRAHNQAIQDQLDELDK